MRQVRGRAVTIAVFAGDQHLVDLVADEVVTYETALAAATDPAHFAQQLRGQPRRSRGAGRTEAAEASGGK